MKPILYQYIHCPYCIRVRLAFNFLKLDYDILTLRYDDEETPLKLTKVKMLPIVSINEIAINESLEIIKYFDKNNYFNIQGLLDKHELKKFEEYFSPFINPIHNLCMPYWIKTNEFDEKSRTYFCLKREVKRGPIMQLIYRENEFLELLNPLFLDLEKNLTPFYKSDKFNLNDIIISAHLFGLYNVPNFKFSSKIEVYLSNIRSICHYL